MTRSTKNIYLALILTLLGPLNECFAHFNRPLHQQPKNRSDLFTSMFEHTTPLVIPDSLLRDLKDPDFEIYWGLDALCSITVDSSGVVRSTAVNLLPSLSSEAYARKHARVIIYLKQYLHLMIGKSRLKDMPTHKTACVDSCETSFRLQSTHRRPTFGERIYVILEIDSDIECALFEPEITSTHYLKYRYYHLR